jgi:hypothetical protein
MRYYRCVTSRLILVFLLSSLPAGWQEVSAQPPPPEVAPRTCLRHLGSNTDLSGGHRLGRAFWDGEVLEPVLIWESEEGKRFRDCSGRLQTEAAKPQVDLEDYASALVARFEKKTATVPTYKGKLGFGSYKEEGRADLNFREVGAMLEARRLSRTYFELTKSAPMTSERAEANHDEVVILLVGTRMESMRLAGWEAVWGEGRTGAQVLRQIFWCELLEGPQKFRVHPAVGDFESLAKNVDRWKGYEDLRGRIVDSATEAEVAWARLVKDNLGSILKKTALALIVVQHSEHIDLTEALHGAAAGSDTVLDIVSFQDSWNSWSTRERMRLVDASGQGRYLTLSQFDDLSRIMPARIAGESHNDERLSSVDGNGHEYLKMKIDPEVLRLGNAIFQDQVVDVANMVNFLGCLLEDAESERGGHGTAELDRERTLGEGLRSVGVAPERLREMSARQALIELLQGFNLPRIGVGDRGRDAGDHNFLGSVKNGNSDLLSAVHSLRSSFEATSFHADRRCDVVMVPDAALFDDSAGVELMSVFSVPGEITLGPEVEPERSTERQKRSLFDSLDVGSLTVGLKAWNASFSSPNLDGGDALFLNPFFSMNLTDRLWVSAFYLEGEAEFTTLGSTPLSGSLQEVDSDLVIGWSFGRFDLGVGYRYAKFTTSIRNQQDGTTTSSGPMLFFGGWDFFGSSRWGYYWSADYMFEDMDDDDGSQEQASGEGGLRWSSGSGLSVLLGYRYKEYFGDGIEGAIFSGPSVNLAYTWR